MTALLRKPINKKKPSTQDGRDEIDKEVDKIFNQKSKELKYQLNSMENYRGRAIDFANFKVQWQYSNIYTAKELFTISIVSNILYYKEKPKKIAIKIKNNGIVPLNPYQIFLFCVKDQSDIYCEAKLNDQQIESGKTGEICCLVKEKDKNDMKFFAIKLRLAFYDREKKKIIELDESKLCYIKVDEVEACIEELDLMFKFKGRFSYSRMEKVLKRNKLNLEKSCEELLSNK